MKNVIIVIQRFSPYEKVGARRWSKFVQYLQKYDDIKINVITQAYKNSAENPWNISINNTKVNIVYLNEPFDHLISTSSFFSKLSGFFKFRVLKHTDEGYGFSKRAFLYLEENRDNLNPDVIIASSPAYSTCYFASKFKKKFPQTKVINDYRDAWIDGFFSWNKGLNSNDTIYKKQVKMELFSLNNCDAVVSVTPELLDKLKNKIKNKKCDTSLITNGFDKRDHKSESPYPDEFDRSKINICHFGTLDFGRDDEFFKLISTSRLTGNIMFYLVGTISDKLKTKIDKYANIKYLSYIQPNRLSSFLAHTSFHLVINDSEFYYAYGSKIFDAMLYSKPVIYVSKENSMVEKRRNDKGFFYSDNSIESNKSMFEQILEYKYSRSEMPTHKEFDIEVLTQKYYELIKKELAA